jgi:hypothetical protein
VRAAITVAEGILAERETALVAARKERDAASGALREVRRQLAAAVERELLNSLARARRKAQATAKCLGLTIEKEDMGGTPLWGVWPPEGVEGEHDPCCGDHYCLDWHEVLDKVNVYDAWDKAGRPANAY